jgi:hypothetical protein
MVSLWHSSGIDLALLWRYCDAALALLMALLCRCLGAALSLLWCSSDAALALL